MLRPMFVWRDARGVVVADVAQGVRQTPHGLRPVYVARVTGEQVEKDRFACAQRVVNEWLRLNRIAATPGAP